MEERLSIWNLQNIQQIHNYLEAIVKLNLDPQRKYLQDQAWTLSQEEKQIYLLKPHASHTGLNCLESVVLVMMTLIQKGVVQDELLLKTQSCGTSA